MTAMSMETLMMLILFLGIFIAIFAGIIYFAFFHAWIEKRKVFYVKKIGNVYNVFKRHTIGTNKVKREATIGEHTFNFDMGKPAYRNRNKSFYFVDVDEGQIALNTKENPEISAKLLQATLKEEVGKQLVAGLDSNPFMGNVLMLIIGIIIGLLGGYILGQFIPMV